MARHLRVYANDDLAGVEVGGAVKNVLAIATGLCDGLALGLNARAALVTRGLAEMTRLGVALGARAETFMGLSGLGDLVLTATGDLSRNRQVGLLLAQGKHACSRRWIRWATWPKASTARAPWCSAPGASAWTCRSPARWWRCSMAELQPAQAVAALMGRGPVAETAVSARSGGAGRDHGSSAC